MLIKLTRSRSPERRLVVPLVGEAAREQLVSPGSFAVFADRRDGDVTSGWVGGRGEHTRRISGLSSAPTRRERATASRASAIPRVLSKRCFTEHCYARVASRDTNTFAAQATPASPEIRFSYPLPRAFFHRRIFVEGSVYLAR